jgi:hypothetical protein
MIKAREMESELGNRPRSAFNPQLFYRALALACSRCRFRYSPRYGAATTEEEEEEEEEVFARGRLVSYSIGFHPRACLSVGIFRYSSPNRRSY